MLQEGLQENTPVQSGCNTRGARWPILTHFARGVTASLPHSMTHASVLQDQIHVLGALLDAVPEASLLTHASAEALQIVHEPSRVAVLTRLRTGDYDAVVFPVFDGSGLPTAPLIQQCAHENADLTLLAICCEPPEGTGALLAAARAGARVVVAPSAPELSALLCGTARRNVQRPDFTHERFRDVEPAMLRDVLTAAAEVVVEGRHVGELASRLNVSPRTLVRHLHSAGLPSARTLLGAARVLWACAIAESAPGRDIAVTARLCGFGTTSRMIRLARQYAVLAGGSAAHPSFPSYDSALAAVVDVVGGRLAR